MNITILAVNRIRPGPELELTENYLDRFAKLGRNQGFGNIEVVEIEPEKTGGRKRSPKCLQNPVCLLDERGQQLSSREFAIKIASWRDEQIGDLTFAIGGDQGKNQLPEFTPFFTLSFGPMVFPHRLARVMLAEQLYRAVSILSGLPYHK